MLQNLLQQDLQSISSAKALSGTEHLRGRGHWDIVLFYFWPIYFITKLIICTNANNIKGD